jgi:thermitase
MASVARRWVAHLVGLVALVALILSGAGLAASAPQRPDVRDDELLVKFRPGAAAAAQAAAHRQVGGQVVREVGGLGVKVVKVGQGQAQQRLQAYLRNPNVEYAEPNGIAYADETPVDPLYSQQWALNNTGQTGGLKDKDIDASQAWNVTTGASSAAIAIVDTGVHETHPDLAGHVIARQSWTTATSDPDDHFGHGTHVAGIAAASANNIVDGHTEGISGVCPNCSLINAKACDDYGACPYDFVANGILYSVGCDIRWPDGTCVGPLHANAINVSLSGTVPSHTLQDAVDKAWAGGAVLTCAAGNNGGTTAVYPAAYANCIAVAATDSRDQRASWSNYGRAWVDVAAPGVSIISTMIPSGNGFFNSSGYGQLSGTSMASPHVAGVAGLLSSRGLTRDQIRSRIESTSDRIDGTGTLWSKGRLNACRAVGGTGC